MEDNKHKFYLTASTVKIEQETPELKKEVAAVIDLPLNSEKQMDLGYFSAVLVSTGTNLNSAHFLGSELLAAADTVNNKAIDVEHIEDEIIGHIYSSAFVDKDHKPLDLQELASNEVACLDKKDMHIHIGCIMYRDRFKDLYEDVASDKYKVSMECYYKDFDIKVGDTIIPKQAAAAYGININDEASYGKSAKVVKDGKEIASGTLARVLRGICFSGVGIVESPANPDSVIVEVASEKDFDIVIDMTEKESVEDEVINVTSKSIEHSKNTEDSDIINHVDDKSIGGEESPDQTEFFSFIKETASKHVDSLIVSKQEVAKCNSDLKRLRNAIDRASMRI
jgi:hypothetical protein